MTMFIYIHSKTTDKDKTTSGHYCSASIEKGKVLSLYVEYGREGGELWSLTNDANGSLQTNLNSLARDWPNFYKTVCKKAYRESIWSNKKRLKHLHNKRMKVLKLKEQALLDKLKKIRKTIRKGVIK